MQINYVGRGIGNYTKNLISALPEVDTKNTYFLFYHPTYKKPQVTNIKDNFTYYPLPMPAKKPFRGFYQYFDQFVLPRILKKLAIDVYHSPDFNPPFFKPCKIVTTIYDLALLKYPYLTGHSRLDNLVFKWKLFNAKRADALITISEFSKSDIVNLLKVKSDDVSVIYPSYNISSETYDRAESENLLEDMGIASPYLLYVGGLNNRMKNLAILIEAFSHIAKNFEKLTLVICGKKEGRYFENMYQKHTILTAELGVSERVIFCGYVSTAALEALYKQARLMVFPSKHEGFGLPVVEAMSFGCPVLASKATAIPEAVGEGGLLFDPDDLDELIEKICLILDDSQLRTELIAKGQERIQRLSWKKAAEETTAVYQEVGSK